MAPKTLGLVDPKEWVSRTTLSYSRTRSGTLARLDAAYVKYHGLQSDGNKQALFRALDDYLIEKGRNWEKVARNTQSGGLMAYFHRTLGPPAKSNVLERRVPETRHGTLYLWQNADVDVQWARIALEGALGLSSATGQMFQASSYNQGDTLAPMGVISKGSIADQGVKALGFADTARGKLFAAKGTAKGNAPMPGFNQTLQGGKWVAPEPHPPFLKLADLKNDPSIVDRARRHLGSGFNEIYKTIESKLKEMYENLLIQYATGAVWGDVGGLLVTLTNFILNKVVANTAPVVAGSISLAQGVCKAIIGAKDRITALQSRQQFIISPGHPQLIGDAIERLMNWAIGKGLYQAAKGGATLAADLVTAGATALINVISACMEFAWKVLTRFLEGKAMKAWIAEVKQETANKGKWKEDDLGVARPGICFDTPAFLALVTKGCRASVCVPMMTLNSGISGDLMMFAKMFDDTGSILGQGNGIGSNGAIPTAGAQSQFKSAEAYWSQMKSWGRDYLTGTGFKFSSTDKLADGLMAHALSHHDAGEMSKADKVLSFIAGG